MTQPATLWRDDGVCNVRDSDNRIVAQALTPETRRLIAAAPDLLAALKAARSFLAYAQTYDRACLTAAEVKACDEAMRLTNSAIAKAEGQ